MPSVKARFFRDLVLDIVVNTYSPPTPSISDAPQQQLSQQLVAIFTREEGRKGKWKARGQAAAAAPPKVLVAAAATLLYYSLQSMIIQRNPTIHSKIRWQMEHHELGTAVVVSTHTHTHLTSKASFQTQLGLQKLKGGRERGGGEEREKLGKKEKLREGAKTATLCATMGVKPGTHTKKKLTVNA